MILRVCTMWLSSRASLRTTFSSISLGICFSVSLQTKKNSITRWASTSYEWSYKQGFGSPQLPIDKAMYMCEIIPLTIVGAHLAPETSSFPIPDCFHAISPDRLAENEPSPKHRGISLEQETLRGMIYKLMEKIDNKVSCFTVGLGSWIPRKKDVQRHTGEAGRVLGVLFFCWGVPI